MNLSLTKYFLLILAVSIPHFAFTQSICRDKKAFSCDYTQIEGISQSDGFGQMQAIEFAQTITSQSNCPFYLMNQYVRDCEEAAFINDSAQRAFEKRCSRKIKSPYTSAKRLEQALRSYTSKDIPPLEDCLEKPFPTNGVIEQYSSPLKMIPKKLKQDFVAEYYTAAQRLRERSRSELQSIAYINQVVGFEDSPSCDHAATDDIVAECEKLQECGNGSQKNDERLVELALGSIVAIKIKKELDEYNKACERQIGHTGVTIPQYEKKCNEKVKYKGKVLNKRKLIQATYDTYKQLYPWIESTKFQDENKEFDLMKKLNNIDGKKQIPENITKRVAQNISKQLKLSRSKIYENALETKNHFNCLTKNISCDKIDGGLFDFDNKFFENDTLTRTSTRMHHLQQKIASSPNLNLRSKKLRPYIRRAQCRQDSRVEVEDKKRLANNIAVDGALFLGSALSTLISWGGTAPTVVASGAKFAKTFGRAIKVKFAKNFHRANALGGTVLVPTIIDDAVNECLNRDKLDYDRAASASSNENICQKLEANVTHTTNSMNCVQMSLVATAGLFFRTPWTKPRFFFRGIKRRFNKADFQSRFKKTKKKKAKYDNFQDRFKTGSKKKDQTEIKERSKSSSSE